MAPIRMMHLITDLDVGGAEMMLCKLVGAMDRRRFEMSVVSLLPLGPLAEGLAANGIAVRSLEMRPGVPDPRGLFRLVGLLRRERVQVLQTWLYHADLLGTIAARLARVPKLAWNLRCSDMDAARYARLPRLLARLSRQPDVVLVNSLAGRAVHERLGYRPRRWEVIPNGFDTERFQPDADAPRRLRADLGLPPDSFVICLPARFDPMKDHGTFLAAAARFAAEHPEARFVLLGRGVDPQNRALRAQVEAIRSADRFLLLGERGDMPAMLAGADIVALSSAFGEGSPNVVGEAMACGVAVVGTDVGDTAQMIGEAGLVVPPRDAVAMAAAWQRLYAMGTEGRRELGRSARQRIGERYALPAIVARYEALYGAMASSRATV